MQKMIKLDFFQKIILSMTDFRFYPYVLKSEKLSQSLAHFTLFIIVLCLLITTKYSMNLFQQVDYFLEDYHSIVPEFSIKDGILQVEETGNIELENGIYAIVDTSLNYSEYIQSEDYRRIAKYEERLLINSDKVTYESADGEIASFSFSNVLASYDKESFFNFFVNFYHDNTTKIVIFFVIFVTLLIGYLMVKFVEIVFLALIASIIASIYRIKIDFKNYLKIAIYCVTFPYIIELISIITVGGVKDYAALASNILAYVYIFYAIRAVKLDAFLLIFNQNGNVKIVKKDENDEKNDDDKDGGKNA